MTLSHDAAGTFPRRVPRSILRADLRAVLAAPGPYVSLFLDLTSRTAAERTELVLAVIDSQPDVTERQRDAVRAVLGNDLGVADGAASEGDVSLLAALVAADGTMVRAAWPDPPRNDVIDVGALPRIGPFLEADQMLAHHVGAIVDDGRLDLLAIPRHGEAGSVVVAGRDPDRVASIISPVTSQTDTSKGM